MGSGEFHLLPKLRKADVCSNEVCPCLSPGGCVSVQGLCETACRGLNRRAIARVLAQSKVIFIQVLAD